MKMYWVLALGVLPFVLAASCDPAGPQPSSDSDALQVYEQMKKEEARAAEKALETAPYKELDAIKPKGKQAFGELTALCLDLRGNLLACDGKARVVRVINPAGEVIATWELSFRPEAIAVDPAGTVFVGGGSKLARLDKDGKVAKLESIDSKSMSALAASEQDVFVSTSLQTGFAIRRLDHNLKQPERIVSGLRGCCGNLDLAVRDGKLYVAENARHRVVTYDREGKVLAKWGAEDRNDISKFGGCCNPMNVCLAPDGSVYTAEAGPDRVKRYSSDGKYLDLVGWFTGGKGCRSVDLAVSQDGRRVYIGDESNQMIRVLERKDAQAEKPKVGETTAKPETTGVGKP